MTTLMIVESPHKAQEIGKFLGAGYDVRASYGHVRDLPATGEEAGELIVGIGQDFGARYEITEKSRATVAKLREAAAAADQVVLATDPDREGEAIAWHLQEVLRLREPQRVTYQEISARAVKAALASPRRIDLNLVRAQEARRVLDRLVGYAVSPVLSRQAGQPLSAGRVQTPALRLVVERERQIRGFVQRLHYGAELQFPGGWKATWAIKPHLRDGEQYWLDPAAADQVAAVRQVGIVDYQDGTASEAPTPPFTTSTLQQEGSKRLGVGVKAVMDAAQALFDTGCITYHRTDNPNFLDEGHGLIRSFAEATGLPLASERRQWKAKAGAQEGHEAIRPVDMAREEAGQTDVERGLYRLIRARAIASQLADARYATRTVRLRAMGDIAVAGVVPEFDAKGRVLTEPGWRVMYAGDAKDADEEASEEEAALNNPIPELVPGADITADSGRRLDKKTLPPRRFTEAGLVVELERRGIGRPSTYAGIIGNITSRSYVVADGKYLVPSKTGEALVDALVGKCRFADYEFTADIEDALDAVASGQRPYRSVVETSWRQLESELPALQMAVSADPEHPCPTCGKALRRRKGASGFFWGCSDYPTCTTTLPDARGKPGKRAEVSQEYRCPKCGKGLVHRVKKGAKGFDFWGCSGFPDCKATYKDEKGVPNLNGK